MNGTYVNDTLSTTLNNATLDKIYTNASADVYSFFLMQDIILGETQKAGINLLGDGILGLTPNLGSGKETYGQYLKRRNLIKEDSFAMDLNYTQSTSTANITFGKFNATAPSASMEVMDANAGKKAWFLKSTGFQFANQTFNFPEKSFIQLDPMMPFNAYLTQNETHYNETLFKFNETMFNLTNGTMNMKWEAIGDANEQSGQILKFEGRTCATVNSTIY